MARCLDVLAAFAVIGALSACGQKGPLYLPNAPEPPPVQQATVEQPADDDQNQLNNE